MGPSPTLVAPGLRTAARLGWRGGVATALGIVVERPALWLLGALGYLLRGGVVVLTLAVVVLPSPVSVRLMLGTYLGSSGFTPEFFLLAGIAGAVLLLLVLAALAVTAWVELNSFERFIAADQAQLVAGRSAAPPAEGGRRHLLAALMVVQLVACLVLALAAVPLVVVAAQVTYAELMRPNLAAGGLYDRVLGQLGEPLFGLLVVLVIVEMVSAVASRRLLARAYGLGAPDRPGSRQRSVLGSAIRAIAAGVVRPLLRPLSTLPTALLGWLVMLAVLASVGWGLPVAWGVARAHFLAGHAIEDLAGTALVTTVFCLAWLVALALAGLASAIRAALWSGEELR